MRNYKEIIDKLELTKVSLVSVEEKDGYDILTIRGGLNGRGDFYRYIEQVTALIGELEFNTMWNIWLIDWINDCLDDLWTLRIGIANEHK